MQRKQRKGGTQRERRKVMRMRGHATRAKESDDKGGLATRAKATDYKRLGLATRAKESDEKGAGYTARGKQCDDKGGGRQLE